LCVDGVVAIVEDHGQAAGIAIGQRPQQHRVHHAEEGSGGADAEGQGDRGRHRETGRAGKAPRRVAEVAPGVVEEKARVRVAYLLADRIEAAELKAGLPAGLVGGHAGLDLLVLERLEGGTHLRVDLALNTLPAERVPERGGRATEHREAAHALESAAAIAREMRPHSSVSSRRRRRPLALKR
jgi:hypothetical protein